MEFLPLNWSTDKLDVYSVLSSTVFRMGSPVKTLAPYFCLVLFISQIIESRSNIFDDFEKNDQTDKLAKESLEDLETAKPQNEPQNLLTKVKTTSSSSYKNKYYPGYNAGYQKHGEDYRRRTILSQL